MRKIIDFNTGWYFSKTSDIPKTIPGDWEQVTLPHTWNAKDGQDGGNDYWRGTACYAKKLEFQAVNAGNRAFIELPGAAMTAEVFINGTKLAHHEGGYSTFRADLTDSLHDGENLICITVDNGANDHVYPQMADFTFYGGLYRGAKLIEVPAEHFELVKDGTPGIKVTPVVDLASKSASVTVETWQNAESVQITVNGETKTVNAADGHAVAEFTIENVHLWNGTSDPYLYEASAKLPSGDEVSAAFGCRKMEFDSEKGFILNGNVYPLRGVARHQDRRGLGNALTIKEHTEDMELIREMGANTVRLAHYQHAQEFYNLCDKCGIIAWAEIPYISKHMPAGRQNTLDQMRELITQNYNHPSICCWGLSNEITAASQADDADLLENHRLLNDLCHRMDSTRPTTMAHVFMLESDRELLTIPDIGSYNLYFGWYIGELEQNDEFFNEYHKNYPDRVIGFSEYGADANPAFHAVKPEKGDYSEEYQCLYHEHILKMIDEHPYLWATHVWNMFDFAADGRDEGGEHGVNQKGLVTMDRKVRKDAYYLYKAAWNKTEPFVHICGSRRVDREEPVTEIKVYSNYGSVTLKVDGEEVGKQDGERIFRFAVPISGEHHIVALSGELQDEITVRKVAEPNSAYLFHKQEVTNWFDQEQIDPTCFSLNDTLGEIMQDPKAGAIVGKMMEQAAASRGDVATGTKDNANLQKMLSRMKLGNLLKQAGDAVKPEQIKKISSILQQIKKPVPKVKLELSADSTISEIFAHEESKAVFDKILPGMRARLEGNSAVLGFKLHKIVDFSHGAIPEQAISAIDAGLKGLNIMVDADKVKKYSENTPVLPACSETMAEEKHTSIRPGQVLRDTEGKRVQAHGGALLYDNGKYYFYGENKDRTDGKSPVWTWGIRAYESDDLYNWKDLGLIIKPDFNDTESGLYPEKHLDRPHIFKRPSDGRWICWIKQSGDESCFMILSADAFMGPWKIEKQNVRPDGLKVGDFDIYADENGNVWLFMDGNHAGIYTYRLTQDCLDTEEQTAVSYEGLFPPFTREAPAVFERNGVKYMLTSGMTGYVPNRSDSATSESWSTCFTPVGDPHVGDASCASFNSQISQVYKVPGKKDLYIALADRWVPYYPVDAARADMLTRCVANHFDPVKYPVKPEEQAEMMKSPMLESANTSIADYVWLPICFEGDSVKIEWLDEWRLEDYN